MPLDFPSTPALNEVYSFGGKSWKWNGAAWETYNDNLGVDFVETVNGITGEVGVEGGTDISVVVSGQTLTINYTGSSVSNAVTSFNGQTGAVQGISSFQGKTGAFGLSAGQGISFALVGNTYTFRIDFVKGAENIAAAAPSSGDNILYEKNDGTLRVTKIGTLLSTPYESGSLPATVTSITSRSLLLFDSADNSQKIITSTNATNEILSGAVTSFNGRTGAVQGVSSANGLTGAVTFRTGAGVTYAVSGSGISFAIDFQHGGQSLDIKAYSVGGSDNPAGVDFLLVQRKNTGGSGEMYLMNITNMFNQFTPLVSYPKYSGVLGQGLLAPLMVQVDGSSPIAVDFYDQVNVISQNLTTVDGGTFA